MDSKTIILLWVTKDTLFIIIFQKKSLKKKKIIDLPDNLKGLTVELPPKGHKADISCNAAMILAKFNKKTPLDLANILKKNFLINFKSEKKSAKILLFHMINYFAILRLNFLRDNQTSYDDVRKCSTIRTDRSFRIKKKFRNYTHGFGSDK